MGHFLLTPGKKLGKLPKICDALGSCCSRGTVFCRFGSWKKSTVCIWTQGIQKWSQKRIPCPPGAGKWAHLLSSTIIYDIVDMGRHLRTGQYSWNKRGVSSDSVNRSKLSIVCLYEISIGGKWNGGWVDKENVLLCNLWRWSRKSISRWAEKSQKNR